MYEKLVALPDLAARLTTTTATVGLAIDLVPPHGTVAIMSTRAAIGSIGGAAAGGGWEPPQGMVLKRRKGLEMRLMHVTEVLAPHLILPGLKKDGGRAAVCLGDFGAAPFSVLVPLTMLGCHADRRTMPGIGSPPSSPAVNRQSGASVAAATPVVAGTPATVDGDDDNDVGMVGPMGESNDEDDPPTASEIEELRAAEAAAVAGGLNCTHLDPAPLPVTDTFSSVLGDAFHFMDRAKVPMHHESKKGYFAALSAAFFVWEPTALKVAQEALAEEGLSNEEIESKLYFNSAWFQKRVPRIIPPPSVLYPRVRAVFALCALFYPP